MNIEVKAEKIVASLKTTVSNLGKSRHSKLKQCSLFYKAVIDTLDGPHDAELKEYLIKQSERYVKDLEKFVYSSSSNDEVKITPSSERVQNAKSFKPNPYNLLSTNKRINKKVLRQHYDERDIGKIYSLYLSERIKDSPDISFVLKLLRHSRLPAEDERPYCGLIPDLHKLSFIATTHDIPLVLQQVMLAAQRSVSSDITSIIADPTYELDALKCELRRFLIVCHAKHNYIVGFSIQPSYEDLMSALLSIYADIVITLSRKLLPAERVERSKELSSFVSYLLSHCPEYYLDVLLQITATQPDDGGPLKWLCMHVFNKSYCMSSVPEVVSPDLYSKYIIAVHAYSKLFPDLMADVVERALLIPAPRNYVDWISKRDSNILDEIPVTKKFRKTRVTRFLLEEATDQLIEDILNLLTADDETKDENEANVGKVSAMDIAALAPDDADLYFFLDKQGGEMKIKEHIPESMALDDLELFVFKRKTNEMIPGEVEMTAIESCIQQSSKDNEQKLQKKKRKSQNLAENSAANISTTDEPVICNNGNNTMDVSETLYGSDEDLFEDTNTSMGHNDKLASSSTSPVRFSKDMSPPLSSSKLDNAVRKADVVLASPKMDVLSSRSKKCGITVSISASDGENRFASPHKSCRNMSRAVSERSDTSMATKSVRKSNDNDTSYMTGSNVDMQSDSPTGISDFKQNSEQGQKSPEKYISTATNNITLMDSSGSEVEPTSPPPDNTVAQQSNANESLYDSFVQKSDEPSPQILTIPTISSPESRTRSRRMIQVKELVNSPKKSNENIMDIVSNSGLIASSDLKANSETDPIKSPAKNTTTVLERGASPMQRNTRAAPTQRNTRAKKYDGCELSSTSVSDGENINKSPRRSTQTLSKGQQLASSMMEESADISKVSFLNSLRSKREVSVSSPTIAEHEMRTRSPRISCVGNTGNSPKRTKHDSIEVEANFTKIKVSPAAKKLTFIESCDIAATPTKSGISSSADSLTHQQDSPASDVRAENPSRGAQRSRQLSRSTPCKLLRSKCGEEPILHESINDSSRVKFLCSPMKTPEKRVKGIVDLSISVCEDSVDADTPSSVKSSYVPIPNIGKFLKEIRNEIEQNSTVKEPTEEPLTKRRRSARLLNLKSFHSPATSESSQQGYRRASENNLTSPRRKKCCESPVSMASPRIVRQASSSQGDAVASHSAKTT